MNSCRAGLVAVLVTFARVSAVPAAQANDYGPELTPFLQALDAYAGGGVPAREAFPGWSDGRWQAGRRALREHVAMEGYARYVRAGAVLYLNVAAEAWAAGDIDAGDAAADRGYGFVSLLERRVEEQAFCVAWYHVAIAAAFRTAHPESAERLIDLADRAFPRDAQVQVSAGILNEMHAWYFQPAPPPSFLWPGAVRVQNDLDRQQLLENAADRYTRALAGAPANPDAHLRLGRVLMLHGRPVEAAAHFEAALAAGLPSILYLAHLFRGRLAEDAGSLARAEDEYASALAAGPSGQTALVAISRIEVERGELPRAQGRIVTLGSFRREVDDPWWDYLSGRALSFPDEWPALRERIRP